MKEYAIQKVIDESHRRKYTYVKDDNGELRPIVLEFVMVDMVIGSSTSNQRLYKKFSKAEWAEIKKRGYVTVV
ncbi:Uncharacterized protein BCRIVMBC845_06442 [Bacillus cereus]|nr:Uncharacterized protein BCRIVMBC845_06442 [Bacillus cereus]